MKPRKYLRIWVSMAKMSFSAQLSHGFGSLGFLVGKLIRLGFFLAYIIAIYRHTDKVAGYSMPETVLFFLTYNLVDITTMIFFRGIYGARRLVQEGDLDYYLIQPCSPLFRMAVSNVDFLDVATMLPTLGLVAWNFGALPVVLPPMKIALYLLLVLNGIAIALAMHIVVAALAVRTQELENAIWIYRDMMFLGRFPVDIYASGLRWALTLVIPIGIMVSFPAKALLGTLSFAWGVYAVLVALGAVAASLATWFGALRHYTSVSS